MGLIDKVVGVSGAAESLGKAASSVAEVFTANATQQAGLDHAAYLAALSEHGAEFSAARSGWFDHFVNALNRLPRPFLALGTMALFIHAMFDPAGFSVRMRGLETIPEPLWWLLGAIISFYFGAREAHYFRVQPKASAASAPASRAKAGAAHGPAREENEAIMDWMARGGRG